MTLKSMTGFARADGVRGDTSWHWEARSVNSRNLDLRLRLPSGFEGLGLAAVEAMMRGLAIVASRIGGLGEVVQPDVTGILVAIFEEARFVAGDRSVPFVAPGACVDRKEAPLPSRRVRGKGGGPT